MTQSHPELKNWLELLLAKDMYSLSTVAKPGFNHLVSKLDPKYSLPPRKYFTKQEIPCLYAENRDGVVEPYYRWGEIFADQWTSCANYPYLGYTVHFIIINPLIHE